jgi:hypothetical protein
MMGVEISTVFKLMSMEEALLKRDPLATVLEAWRHLVVSCAPAAARSMATGRRSIVIGTGHQRGIVSTPCRAPTVRFYFSQNCQC